MLQELQEQEEEYRDNMPENLQGSEKYERADEACSNLSDAYDSLQDAIDNLETDEGVEAVAREKLGMVSDNEIVFRDVRN